MPADTVDRAIKKGTGELPGVVYAVPCMAAMRRRRVALLLR